MCLRLLGNLFYFILFYFIIVSLLFTLNKHRCCDAEGII